MKLATIGMIAGDTEAIWNLMGQSISNDQEFQKLLEQARGRCFYSGRDRILH